MNPIPWRIRAAISRHFPLVYHLAANLFGRHQSPGYWDARLAETWHLRTWPTKNALIARYTPLDAAILDIACGNGSILRDLKARGYGDLSGLEISEYAVGRLREEGFTMYPGKVPYLPVPDAGFDAIIASQILEHVIRRDVFANEIKRALKPGGQAFFFVPDDCLGPIDEPEHVVQFNARTFEAFLVRHFEVISIERIKDENFSMPILFGRVRPRNT